MRYQIWDKKSNVFTPSGNMFTPEQWIQQFRWAAQDGVKMIITTGAINGGVAMEFESTKERYKQMGASITEEMSDEEVLLAIEEFEDNPPTSGVPSVEERTAAALEAQVLLAMPDTSTDVSTFSTFSAMNEEGQKSAAYDRVFQNYKHGLWGRNLVIIASQKGEITQVEAEEILS